MAVLSFAWKLGAPAPQEPESPPVDSPTSPFVAAIEVLPDAALLVERRQTAPIRILTANAAAQDLLRIRAEEGELIVAVRHPAILAAVEDTLASAEDRMLDCETGGQQSRALRVWTRALPLPGRSCALIVLRDETEARRIEQMRADFLANASHELRTPLASLAGYIETLRGHAKDDEAARGRFLSIMSAQARRMSRLIDDLLSLSRIELNEHVPPSGQCDVAIVAREAIDGLSPLASSRGVLLELGGPDSGEAIVTGDRDQLAQVIQNLIDNAVKFSPERASVRIDIESDIPLEWNSVQSERPPLRESGGGRLTLLFPEQREPNRYVRVSVTDQGKGIGREHLPRLTERFYRVPGQRSSEGTGLGLAIVKHIVNRHRGALMVESAPGESTFFAVYLPQAPGDRDAASPALASQDVTKAL